MASVYNFANLTELVDFLIQSTTENPNKVWKFVYGKLQDLDCDTSKDEKEFEKHTLRKDLADLTFTMRQVSWSVQSYFEALLRASNFQNRVYNVFARNDVNAISEYFNYFALLLKKIKEDKKINMRRGMICARSNCLVYDNCPIFTTLSRFVASNYAASNTTNIYVTKKYLIPALSFAFFLHKMGFEAGVVNVFPAVHELDPGGQELYGGRITGIIPIELTVPINLKPIQQNNTNTFYLKRHPSFCPFLILKSADIDSAVWCLVDSTKDLEGLWLPNIVYVEEQIYQTFLKRLRLAADVTNQATDRSTDWSVCEEYFTILMSRISIGICEVIPLNHLIHSCSLIVHDDLMSDPDLPKTDSDSQHQLILIMPVKNEAEGVREINKNRGLCASVWTKNADQIVSIPQSIEYGTVWVNCACLYDASVSFPMWNSHGTGSMSGKRMFFESSGYFARVKAVVVGINFQNQNATLWKRPLATILLESSVAFECWSETPFKERLRKLKRSADIMKTAEKFLPLNGLDLNSTTWHLSKEYMNLWSEFSPSKRYDETLFVHRCWVTCKSLPIGIIAIIVGCISVEKLFFYMGAALAYGNVLILGMCTDEPNYVGTTIEKLFEIGLLSVTTGTREELWSQFTTSSSISAVWFHGTEAMLQGPLSTTANHQIIYNMDVAPQIFYNKLIDATAFMETYATKMKCVWLPHVDKPPK